MAQPTLVPLPGHQPPGLPPSGPQKSRASLSSVYVLARWQLKQTWRLLVVTGLGMLIAVVLVCSIPLYVQVALSAGLRHVLEEEPQNTFLTVHAQSALFDTDSVQGVQQQLTSLIANDMGSTVSHQPALSVQIGSLATSLTTFMRVIGANASQLHGHVKLLAGHLPLVTSGDTIEFLATTEDQQGLQLQLGKTFTLSYPVFDPTNAKASILLHFQLVGIIAQPAVNDLFWHGETFATESLSMSGLYPVLVSNTELMNVLTEASNGLVLKGHGSEFSPSGQPDIYWYYNFDFSHLDVNQLPAITNSLNNLLSTLPNSPAPPYVINAVGLGPSSVLQNYTDQLSVLQLPTLGLTFLISALALFFVLLMTDVLVERQIEAITLLRSRGASGRQVFSSLLGQSTALGLLALVGGPLLAIPLVVLLATLGLSAGQQGALNVILADPLGTAQGLLGRDLIIVGVALLAMVFSIWRVIRSNALIQQRERTRSTHRPFWQRYRLDLLAALIALVGFGLAIYIAGPGVLDVKTQVLILPLTSLVGMLFLLVGCLLLFLRAFSAVLRWGEGMAARNRGVAPVLALAQIVRTPRQSLRMTLLFALAVALTLFTVMFSATQEQRLQDITTYQVGSDFSGMIPPGLQSDSWNQQLAYYQGIKGITSVTMGDSELLAGGSNSDVNVEVEAIDSSSYARTFYWPTWYSDQPINVLMKQLQEQSASATKDDIIPAIVDDATARALNVGQGQQFVLADYHGPMSFVVTAIVHSIPTVYEAGSNSGLDSIPQGGMLVDFQTYSNVALAVNENGVSASEVWLRADARQVDLGQARQTLFSGTYALENGLDRIELAQELATDPLYKALLGILAVGAAVALLLALVGNLLVSWLNARGRRTHFAVLRALGCGPGQLARVLIWEQGIVYTISLALGVLLSVLFALVVLPAFVFSPLLGTGSVETFYLLQSVPAVQTVVPLGTLLGVMALLIGICITAIIIMVRVVSQPQMSQVLRISED